MTRTMASAGAAIATAIAALAADALMIATTGAAAAVEGGHFFPHLAAAATGAVEPLAGAAHAHQFFENHCTVLTAKFINRHS